MGVHHFPWVWDQTRRWSGFDRQFVPMLDMVNCKHHRDKNKVHRTTYGPTQSNAWCYGMFPSIKPLLFFYLKKVVGRGRGGTQVISTFLIPVNPNAEWPENLSCQFYWCHVPNNETSRISEVQRYHLSKISFFAFFFFDAFTISQLSTPAHVGAVSQYDHDSWGGVGFVWLLIEQNPRSKEQEPWKWPFPRVRCLCRSQPGSRT